MIDPNPDVFLALDIESFFKANWQSLDYQDALALINAYLVVIKVLGISREEINGDKMSAVLGLGIAPSAWLADPQNPDHLAVPRENGQKDAVVR